jgi:hypothetical protein
MARAAAEHQHRAAHDVEGMLMDGRVGVRDRDVHADAGVVDDRLDGSCGVLDPGRHAGHLGTVGEIGGDRLHVDAV